MIKTGARGDWPLLDTSTIEAPAEGSFLYFYSFYYKAGLAEVDYSSQLESWRVKGYFGLIKWYENKFIEEEDSFMFFDNIYYVFPRDVYVATSRGSIELL